MSAYVLECRNDLAAWGDADLLVLSCDDGTKVDGDVKGDGDAGVELMRNEIGIDCLCVGWEVGDLS